MFIKTKTKIMSKYIKKKQRKISDFKHMLLISLRRNSDFHLFCVIQGSIERPKYYFFSSRLLKQEETYKKNLSLFKTQKRKPNNSYTHISLFDHLLSLPGDNKTQVTIIICQIIKLKKIIVKIKNKNIKVQVLIIKMSNDKYERKKLIYNKILKK